eukprot:scaffold6749_cov113-Cylindrotheca_fusiformis.AAC.9
MMMRTKIIPFLAILVVEISMGKRKQAKPRRNVNATVLEAVPRVPAKRRRRIVEEDEESTSSSVDDVEVLEAVDWNIRPVNNTFEDKDALESSVHTNYKTGKPPLHEMLDQAVTEVFSDVADDRSLRRVEDQLHLQVIVDNLLLAKASPSNSEAVLPSIVDFDMICLYIARTRKDEPRNILGNCVFSTTLPLPERSKVGPVCQVYICLTDSAFKEASPESVSTFLLGTNTIRRKTKSLHATLSIRRALASLFPGTLVDAVNSDPSGQSSDTVKARFIYELVDNVRFQAKCQDVEKSDDTTPPEDIPGLRPTMRRYQSYAVEWMLSREQNEEPDDGIWRTCWSVLSPQLSLQPLAEYLETIANEDDREGKGVTLFNPFTGWLCRSIKEARLATVGPDYVGVRGGILAESMGESTIDTIIFTYSQSASNIDSSQDLAKQWRRPGEDITQFTEGLTVTSSVPQPSTAADFDTSAVYLTGQDDVCTICSKSTTRSLGWVRCSECKERIHSDCAGYNSRGDIPTSTFCSPTRCPCCMCKAYATDPIKSRGTLIVMPPAILEQWAREIRRHTAGSLKVVVYPGIKKLCNNTCAIGIEDRLLVHPRVLADADVVLTTFPVLNSELFHSDNQFLENGKSIRRKKRYRVVPSPLNSIEWWRICLDEAQRVEGTAAAAAKMALRLRGKLRWCVSGTPVGRGRLEDLYGLLLFVGVMPFQDKESFRHCLHGSFPGLAQRLKHILYPIFWRSTKANPLIRQQLGVPEQVERKMYLEFSSIEKHFYKRQLENLVLAMDERSDAMKKSEDISSRLHSLRAACCHPQVGSSGIQKLGSKALHTVSNRVLSMQQVLDKLIDDARLKCEESQRIAILHTNALACISKLKVELKRWQDPPLRVEDSDYDLLSTSANSYLEALELTDKNAKPSEVIGEAELSGCDCFLNQGLVIRDGIASLSWNLTLHGNVQSGNSVWANIDFNTGKKLTAFKVRQITPTENDAETTLLPKDCVLQVSLASLGGAFVDVRRFSFDKCGGTKWLYFDGIRTNRSKAWRFQIESYHQGAGSRPLLSHSVVGVEIHFMEPTVGSDDLQRMHILHNSALVVDSLIQCPFDNESTETLGNLKNQLRKVNTELKTLESNYLGSAKANHRASRVSLRGIVRRQNELENELRHLSSFKGNSKQRLWKDAWWQDLLSFLQVEDSESIPSQAKENLCALVRNDLYELFNGPFDVGNSGFPEFRSIFGLRVALKSRKERDCCDRSW